MNYLSPRRGQTQKIKNIRAGQALSDNVPVSIGQVKPDVSRKQAGKLSGSRLTYKCCSGFTLIELLVVVLIIGILAAVALPQYNKAVKKAQGAEALAALDALDKGLKNYYLENGTFEGATPDTLSITPPELTHVRYSVGCPDIDPVGSSVLTNLNIQAGTTQSANVTLLLPGYDVYVRASWQVGCHSFPEINCYVSSRLKNSRISCSDYFNCNANLTYHPVGEQIGTSEHDRVTEAYYSGGNCKLK